MPGSTGRYGNCGIIKNGVQPAQHNEQDTNSADTPANSSRRCFLGSLGSATAMAVVVGIPLGPLLGGKASRAEAAVIPYGSRARAAASFEYREDTAESEKINVGVLPDNGDAQRFTDFSGNWSKCLKHDGMGVPNAASWSSMAHALRSGRFQDFENIMMGTPGGHGPNSTLNGPQGGLAFDLEGLDSHATVIPPAPSVASAQTAAEQVEHYWGALMRDVQFVDYPSSQLAAQAAADMNTLSFIRSNANNQTPYPVTPQNLFRGQFYPGDGNVQGPYLSQFLIQPTFFGAQPLTQQYQRFLSLSEGGAEYMTSLSEYQDMQNGVPPTRHVAYDAQYRFMRMGRDLAT